MLKPDDVGNSLQQAQKDELLVQKKNFMANSASNPFVQVRCSSFAKDFTKQVFLFSSQEILLRFPTKLVKLVLLSEALSVLPPNLGKNQVELDQSSSILLLSVLRVEAS